MANDFREKSKKLLTLIDNYTDKDILIAFSGGVDSSLLLKLACESAHKNNKKVYAVTVHTQLHPMNDIVIAKEVAKEAGAIHLVIQIDELEDAGIKDNPVDRCYLCKKYLFSKLKEVATNLNIDTILEGTNEDDLHVYRPGIKALDELGIKSPLAKANMTKADVRRLAHEYNISVAQRPSTPCLATRFPYGTNLSYENMKKVEQAEEYLRSMGFYNVRVRVHDDIARIEVDEIYMDKLIFERKNIINYMKNLGYTYITLDLEGFRSGSMDYKIK